MLSNNVVGLICEGFDSSLFALDNSYPDIFSGSCRVGRVTAVGYVCRYVCSGKCMGRMALESIDCLKRFLTLVLVITLVSCDSTAGDSLVLRDTTTRKFVATLQWPNWAEPDCGNSTRLVAESALKEYLDIGKEAVDADFRYGSERGVSDFHYFIVQMPKEDIFRSKRERFTVICQQQES